MNRKETTEFLGRLLKKERFGGIGKYWASEVSIDPWSTKGKGKRVDYMQFIPDNQCAISALEKRDFRMLRGKELQRGCIQWKRFEFPRGKELHSYNDAVL